MVVEFVGCSGAGKTTLLRDTVNFLRTAGIDVADSRTVVCRATGSGWIPSESAQNIVIDLMVRATVRFPAEAAHFIHFGAAHIRSSLGGRFDRFNRIRGLRRQVATGEFCRARTPVGSLCLVDEGPLGSAHSVCVCPASPPGDETLKQWLGMVPKPDLALYVAVSVETVVERTLRRADPPLRGKTARQLEAFVRAGHEVFCRLSRMAEADWWVNLDGSAGEQAARQAAELIRGRLAA